MPPSPSPEFIAQIERRLSERLAASEVTLSDDGARHVGHAQAAGRFHLKLRIVSARFAGLAPVARHRLVYDALAEELAGPIHALNINALAPGE
ncbi:MAG: BolA family protein [Gammaproteobacteria bacterium]